jgi:hypothetical protein
VSGLGRVCLSERRSELSRILGDEFDQAAW